MRFRLWPLLALLVIAGCRPANEAQNSVSAPTTQSAFPKDDLGREVTLTGEIKRLVVIGPGAIETIYALGVGDKLVGRDSFASEPPPAAKVAVAGDYQGPSVEKCIALRPDLVIVQGETWDLGRVESWQKQIGAPVAALTATSLRAVREDFVKMGQWLGREEEARKLAASLDVKPKSPSAKAFVEVGRSPLFTAGKGTLVSDVLAAGGFGNVADDVKGYQPFGIESLLTRQPDFYVAPTSSSQAAVTKELRATPALSKLKCIRDGRIIAINSDYLLRPGPRLRFGIERLQKEARN